MDLKQNIQDWANLDTEIQYYTNKISNLRKRRYEVEENLTEYIETNKPELMNRPIKIQVRDSFSVEGSNPVVEKTIKIVKSNVIQGLTFKYLETALASIISNEEQAKKVFVHIRDNREIKQKTEIKRV